GSHMPDRLWFGSFVGCEQNFYFVHAAWQWIHRMASNPNNGFFHPQLRQQLLDVGSEWGKGGSPFFGKQRPGFLQFPPLSLHLRFSFFHFFIQVVKLEGL